MGEYVKRWLLWVRAGVGLNGFAPIASSTEASCDYIGITAGSIGLLGSRDALGGGSTAGGAPLRWLFSLFFSKD
ncbi:MAG: hypothetical protein IMF07_00880 [Proteobacteria bacterium]|nr:hypothetical protein [Pseudomonadota bacterium]